MRLGTKLSLVCGWLPLALALVAPGCRFFDDTVYCDTTADCPTGLLCDLEIGECKGGSPVGDGGELPDAGPHPDAGGDTDAGPGDDDAGTPGDDGGTPGDDAGSDGGPEVPTAPGIALRPDVPRTLDDLYVEIIDESVANGPVTYRYEWRRDDVVQPDLVGDRVPAARTAKGQTWRVTVTANANGVDGVAAVAQATIANTPPSLRGVALYPLRPTLGDTLEAVPVGYYDPDEGDPRTVELRWFNATTGSTNPLQQGGATTFDASSLFSPGGDLAIRVVAIPRDSGQAGAAGAAVTSCDRVLSAKPTWQSAHPVGTATEDFFPGGQYLHYDEAHDRLLLGVLQGRELHGAYELSLATPDRGWSLIDVAPGFPRIGPAQVWLPSRGAFLQFGGLAYDGGTSFNVADTALWLDVTHGCEALTDADLPPGPSGRFGSAAQYDPSADRAVVLLGATHDGLDYVGTDEVWALSLADDTWTQLTPSGTAPTGRAMSATVYDPVDHQVVIYGGLDATNIEASPPLGDLHALSLTEGQEAWRTLTPSGSGPGARLFAGVGLHEETHALVVLGGCPDQTTCATTWHDDAYRLTLTPGLEEWAPLALEGDPLPGPVLEMVADPHRGVWYVLAIDAADPSTASRQLLELVPGDGDGAWTLQKRWSRLDDVPPARARFALVGPSVARDELFAIYGGQYTGYAPDERALDDVWRFVPATGRWIEQQQGGPRPSPRHSFAWAAGQHSESGASPGGLPLLLFGGRCETGPGTFEPCGGTYQVEPSVENTVFWKWWTGSEGLPPSTFESAGFLARPTVARTLRFIGGRDPSGEVVTVDASFRIGGTGTFESGAWETGDYTPPALTGAAAAVSPRSFEDLAYLFGGLDAQGDASDVLYVGSAVGDWAFEVVNPVGGVAPSARQGATLTHIAPGKFLLYGGSAPFDDVPDDLWLLDCNDSATPVSCQWHRIELPAERSPRARAFHGAAYDARRDRLWVFGGDDFGSLAETWSLGPLQLILDEL